MEENRYNCDQSLYKKYTNNLDPDPHLKDITNLKLSIDEQFQEVIIQNRQKELKKIKKGMSMKHKNSEPQLKNLITRLKSDRLVRNFVQKIKRNIIKSKPIEYKLPNQKNYPSYFEGILNRHGFEMPTIQIILFTIISILLIVVLTTLYTLTLIFVQVQNYQYIKEIQKIGFIFYLAQMFFNFITKNYHNGQALIFIHQIAVDYLIKKFSIDFLSLIVLGVDCFTHQSPIFIKYSRLIIVIKLSQNLQKLETLQNIFITNFIRQQYWGLFTVIAINFSFAHILSILLNAMTYLNPNDNWIISHGLVNSQWYQRYIWGFYWGTTIMLTVGFVDFAATNYQQAICITFIQMFSCISLAYNINCVGALVSNLRSRSNQKNKSLKTFNQMSKKNNLSFELQKSINNYIQGSFLIKKSFNIQQQDKLINNLPIKLKNQYLQQANHRIFDFLPILKDFTKITKNMMAQKIIKCITHPEEIIQKRNELAKMIILQEGEIGFVINQKKSLNNGLLVQKFKVKNQIVKLLTLDFIKNKRLNFNIKSLSYSILYCIQKQDLNKILKQNSYDYQHFCMLRDREEYIINENQIQKCDLCINEYHSKFNCPSIHYLPLHQHIINKYICEKQKSKQFRRYKDRKRIKYSNFQIQKFQNIRHFRRQHLGDNYITSYKSINLIPLHIDNQLNNYQQSKKSMKILNALSEHTHEQPNINILVQIVRSVVYPPKQNFWEIEVDNAYNWKYYFTEDNPINLNKKKRRNLRNKK